MYFTGAVIVSLASMATVGFAARPIDVMQDDFLISKMNTDNLKVCTETDWEGTCTSVRFKPDVCTNLKDLGLSNVIRSISVPDDYRCRLWDSETCNGDNVASIYPGEGKSLHQGGDKSFADMATSFKRYKT